MAKDKRKGGGLFNQFYGNEADARIKELDGQLSIEEGKQHLQHNVVNDVKKLNVQEALKEDKQLKQHNVAKQVSDSNKQKPQKKEKGKFIRRSFDIELELWEQIQTLMHLKKMKQVDFINNLFKQELEANAERIKIFEELLS